MLVGCDFSYGYPHGFAATLGSPGDEPAWSYVWRTMSSEVHDSDSNHNDRFAAAARLNQRVRGIEKQPGPFWGAPVGSDGPFLSRYGPPFPFHTRRGSPPLERLRLVDRRLPVQEAWKLYGAGSVGSQALLGIPRVSRLRWHPELAAVSQVWPFETGFRCDSPRGPHVVHAEIWPGTVANRVTTAETEIRDKAQVRAMARWAAEEDAAGRLAAFFDQPEHLDDAGVHACRTEEGWILGLPTTTPERRPRTALPVKGASR